MSDEKDIFGGLFTSEESERFAVLKTFFEPEGINFKTDLGDESIKAISIVEFIDSVIEDEFKVKLDLKGITDLFKQLRVSRKREGRKEGIRGLIGKEEEDEKGILRKALGIP